MILGEIQTPLIYTPLIYAALSCVRNFWFVHDRLVWGVLLTGRHQAIIYRWAKTVSLPKLRFTSWDHIFWDRSRHPNRLIFPFHNIHDRIKQFLILMINFSLFLLLLFRPNSWQMSKLLWSWLICQLSCIIQALN